MSNAQPQAPTVPAQTSRFAPGPTLAEVRTGSRVLEKFHTGDAVKHVQRLLHLSDDGFYGDDTTKAVAAFQQKHGMAIDPGFLGKVGRFTLTAMEQSATLPAVTVVPDTAGNFDPKDHLSRMHPEFKRRFLAVVAALAAKGMRIRVTDGLRTFEEQDKLFQKGRHLVNGEWKCIHTKCRNTVTNARGGRSNHNYGMALDCYPVIDGKVHFFAPASPATLKKRVMEVQEAIGVESERVGLTWGGRWTSPFDPPHVQLMGQDEMPTAVCLQVFRDNGNKLQAVWDEATRRIQHRNL